MHILFWALIIAAILLGGMAFAIILRHFAVSDWDAANRAGGGPIMSFILVAPFVWFILVTLIVFIAEWLFSHTEKGYKIRPFYVVVGMVALSCLAGVVLFSTHVDIPIDHCLRKALPMYEQHLQGQNKPFNAPERGVIVGDVLEMNPRVSMMIIDAFGNKWTVDTSGAEMQELIDPFTGVQVGIMGERTGRQLFRARVIHPWRFDLLRHESGYKSCDF
jgi:hypothetical protein